MNAIDERRVIATMAHATHPAKSGMKALSVASIGWFVIAVLGCGASPETDEPLQVDDAESVNVKSLALTVPDYSTYIGGVGQDIAKGVAVDGLGNVYVAGMTTSYGVGNDVFVSKWNSSGTLVYSIHFGGSGEDIGQGLAIDGAGNVYVTGRTTSYGVGGDVFVAKLNALGTALLYFSYFGGSGDDSGTAITIGAEGSVYVAGTTFSTSFPVSTGAFQSTLHGTADAFVTKLTAAGNSAVYSTYLGGGWYDAATGVAVDAQGIAYVTGNTLWSRGIAPFPTTAGALKRTAGDSDDAFVAALAPSGSALTYGTYLGGSRGDQAHAITVDASSNAYVTGMTASPDFPTTPGAFRTALYGGNGGDVFVTKLNAAGTDALFSTFIGGSGSDDGLGISVSVTGNVYVTGQAGLDYPTTADAFRSSSGGGFDAFVSELSATGSALLYSTYLGGSLYDVGTGIALDNSDHIYIAGTTQSTNFPVFAATQSTFGGGARDGFVFKL